jgi:hypothetical protein
LFSVVALPVIGLHPCNPACAAPMNAVYENARRRIAAASTRAEGLNFGVAAICTQRHLEDPARLICRSRVPITPSATATC